jgi:hypothetical protein
MNNGYCLSVAYDLKRGQAKCFGRGIPIHGAGDWGLREQQMPPSTCAKLFGHRLPGLRAHDINTTDALFHRMNNIVSLFDFLVRKAQKQHWKLIKSEAKGKRKKARKHERKLLALNLKIGFFKRHRKSSDQNHVVRMARF